MFNNIIVDTNNGIFIGNNELHRPGADFKVLNNTIIYAAIHGIRMNHKSSLNNEFVNNIIGLTQQRRIYYVDKHIAENTFEITNLAVESLEEVIIDGTPITYPGIP
ncbi:hypothetical protein SAMN03080594_102264 [Arenibacter palladensis]|uniref:Right handed beta helix region n=1 Tax=Arenibacter palladensis TaxID=237373 RepID=A0A1M4Y079_9FLAO|nr:hypothetical protein [Arenibacter palladensis]SHE99080.1 hypothetical protein SAMN03080594_102264 [Arenibacter palladensis]